MAFTANTAFEVKVGNGIYNGLQNIAGKYGTLDGSTFTGADISAGFFAVQTALIPSEGYESIVDGSSNPTILNGNTWYMGVASSGIVDGYTGDHTGIYAANPYDVNKVTSGDLSYNLGQKTLGLGIPAGERGDFTELIVGEMYKFGAGNFAATPTVGQYVTISSGKWSSSSGSAPTTGAIYGKVLRTEPFNEGASFFGTGYVVQILRSVAAG